MRGLGINSDMKLRWVEDRHLEFLDYHHKMFGRIRRAAVIQNITVRVPWTDNG